MIRVARGLHPLRWGRALSTLQLQSRTPPHLNPTAQQRWASQWVPAGQFGTLHVTASVPLRVLTLDGSPGGPPVDSVEDLTTKVCIDTSDDGAAVEVTGGTGGSEDDVHVDASELTAGTLTIWVPFSMGVHAVTSTPEDEVGGVEVVATEGAVRIMTTVAPVSLVGLKGGPTTVITHGGDITATSLQGDVDFRSEFGSIFFRKVQSITMHAHTKGGRISGEALYAQNATISTVSGNITLGSVHGDSRIASQSGNVFVGTGEGTLSVRTTSGSVEAHLNQPEVVELFSESGDVTVTTTEEESLAIAAHGSAVNTALDNAGATVHYDVQESDTVVAKLNADAKPDVGVLAIATKGKVTLGLKSWFEASTALTSRLGSL